MDRLMHQSYWIRDCGICSWGSQMLDDIDNPTAMMEREFVHLPVQATEQIANVVHSRQLQTGQRPTSI